MDLTPDSIRSPMSPYSFKSNGRPSYEYPSPAQSDTNPHCRPSPPVGLGLYDCPLPASASPHQEISMAPLPSSTAAIWHSPALHSRSGSHHSHGTPNIFSEEYDPFAPFHNAMTTSYTHSLYTASPAPIATLPASPVPSCDDSQRSSFSAPTSETFAQYAAQIKSEDHVEWTAPNGRAMMMASSIPESTLLPASNTSFPVCYEAPSYYSSQSQQTWPKLQEKPNMDYNSSRAMSNDSEQLSTKERRRSLGPVARTRQPRKLTTREEANFICPVEGCGKLFGRSYNYKAHLETHDASRVYPFPCPVKDCNKKFVRKTDLARHNQSVHMKQRNHQCSYCCRFFARKDTLRRHMEDGCSKRFDLGTVDFTPQEFQARQQDPKDIPRSMALQAARAPSSGHLGSVSYTSSPSSMSSPYLNTTVTATAVWPS